MEDCRAELKLLLIILYVVHLSSSDTHSLEYHYTVNGHSTAVGLVDGEQVVSYDSNIRKMIPKTEWMKKIEVNDPRYWDRETQRMKVQQDEFQAFMYLTKQRFNHTKGDHIVQRISGCERDDDVTTRGYDQYSYDGEDFISLDLRTGTWTAANDKAERFINDWDPKGTKAEYWKDFLETDCIHQLKKFVSLQRKVCPEVSMFHRHSSPSPEVVCHATGFLPKPLNITWQKDGEDVREDVELRETLPNQDGSFQKRSILKVPAEELQKHTYTCVVQHSSLEKEIRIDVPKGSDLGSDAAQIPILALMLPVALIFFVLYGIILVWKKNSGERRKEADVKFSDNRFTLSNSSLRPVPPKLCK
ncbi:H-2 class I histocompatibility antigen, Q8 alpha chain-like [Clarias gariepinus]|uniref:H-2 class I histocompatibility antigen, Q8 alpha chain-like n=1 Tax=Clarias gariepinus TaxID=13013 RepID=UPI00234C0FFA|nr:H-2 class I histocompatibility antigen, Q8 alpha chain-like [Clarias gariepinus]